MRIFLTGGAGFIGFHAAKALLARGHIVAAIDDLNPYYDPALKRARLKELEGEKSFRFVQGDIADPGTLVSAAGGDQYDLILHLAAQAGVRYALTDPAAYTRANLVGHHNVLEFARGMKGLSQLVYASSSSVYGNDTAAPYSETARADHPVSYYGATKRAGELLSHSYAELYGLPQTGLRFFTVYGPWGRPDMAYWLFTDAILHDRPVPVFGGGKLKRDFTYIDDIVSALVRIVETPFVGKGSDAPHRVYNLGNSHPEEVSTLIRLIEQATGKRAKIEDAKGPPGDVRETYADIAKAGQDFGFVPKIPLAEGIPRFVEWYRKYHRI
ncbi:MAG TPA: NAD-dependent epimerase/dehydratase family protein [Rhizomicrobium sp.]